MADDNLLAISIGPVQDFIKAARKARDLWFGSALLSEVSRAAAKAVLDYVTVPDEGMIFPPLDAINPPTAAGETKPAVANKLLARVSGDPAAIASEAKAAAQKVLDDYWTTTKAKANDSRIFDLELGGRQVTSFLEFGAAWVPYQAASYAKDRQDLELLLAGRKALRAFGPAENPAPSSSSHRYGSRQTSSLDDSRKSIVLNDKLTRPRWRLKRGEHLDGISLIKRLATSDRFVSTSRIALEPFFERVATRDDAKADLQTLRDIADDLSRYGDVAVEWFDTGKGKGLDHFDHFPYDTELFYETGLEDATVEVDDKQTNKPLTDFNEIERKHIADQLQRFKTTLKLLTGRIGEPSPYFAVLVADGDRMGAAIGTMTSPAAHIAFSNKLNGFAAQAAVVVRKHQGALIYSGGDDVLAFVPVHRVLACADALRNAFELAMKDATGTVKVSLSVGVSIGHYREPLDNLLAWGRKAEAAAKNGPDRTGSRNSLAVALHTSSGGADETTVVHSWTSDPVQARWAFWQTLYREKRLTSGVAYELRDLAYQYVAIDQAEAVLAGEVRRILNRKRTDAGSTPMTDADLRDAMAMLTLDRPPGDTVERTTVDHLLTTIDEMLIARRLSGPLVSAPASAAQPTTAPGSGGGA